MEKQLKTYLNMSQRKQNYAIISSYCGIYSKIVTCFSKQKNIHLGLIDLCYSFAENQVSRLVISLLLPLLILQACMICGSSINSLSEC